MAKAFGGSFTALYVKTSSFESLTEEDRKRLQKNTALAESLGADTATVNGDDVSFQIAEFARLSGVTQIVIGRSNTKKRHFWSKSSLTDKLIEIAPTSDIHIIPDATSGGSYKEKRNGFASRFVPYPKDLLITVMILIIVTLIGMLFLDLGITEANIIAMYILGVLLTAIFTRGYVSGIISSIAGVILFNFFMTEPRFDFRAYDPGYSVTFAIMLVISIVTCTLTSKLKDQAKLSAMTAFRTKVLFDTSNLLKKVSEDEEVMKVLASQLNVMLDRNVIVYPESMGQLMKGYIFTSTTDPEENVFFSAKDREAAELALIKKGKTGHTTDMAKDAECLYIPIKTNEKVYGVVGIQSKGKQFDSFESSVADSIIGEGALTIERNRTAREKEKSDLRAKNERLRSNLLRSISHDLRTPLTSISGNASNLLSNYQALDSETRTQMFTDIYDDAQWLISLVENLLFVTRMEDGTVKVNTSAQLIEEVIDEALRHLGRKKTEHNITVKYEQELLLAKIDARMIIQVVINIVDNAIKYTPPGSDIVITAGRSGDLIRVSIADNGAGISDSEKEQVFEMFFTGNSSVADSRRSLGLGLALCRAIIRAHGGELTLSDNIPHGSVFTFTLQSGEVDMPEMEEENER
ncbi:MAG: sensor histidine kinase KdpD [Clostridia bacterium]|nr:sensor histidine kinase KdpD [Clostridia bacterium]